MLTGAQLCTQAAQDAHFNGGTAIAQLKLQIILDELCFKHDFALARGEYTFNLVGTTNTIVTGVTNFGGPYPLPLDYLRTSGSSGADGVQYAFFYYINGVPYPLIPRDLGAMDMEVQQTGLQSYPTRYATDISPESTAQDRIALVTTGNITNASTSLTGLASTAGLLNGMSVAGYGIAAGSTISGLSGSSCTLSLAATATFTGAALMFGTPPTITVYPGPSGSFPAILRYQRLMPPLLDFTRVPWFPDQNYLLVRLTADMMSTADDQRRQEFLAEARGVLGQYEQFKDDKTSRAQTVLLDRNRFTPRRGSWWGNLKNTKQLGW